MKRTVQSFAVAFQARSFAGLSLGELTGVFLLLKHAAFITTDWTDAAFAAATPARANALAV